MKFILSYWLGEEKDINIQNSSQTYYFVLISLETKFLKCVLQNK